MISTILMLAAAAQEPCPIETLTTPRETLSVAWISPVRRHVHARTTIAVVPTTALRTWVGGETPTVGRMLQRVGLRADDSEPWRRYKVVVFDVSRETLCRAVDLFSGAEHVAGVPICAPDQGKAVPHDSGCGFVLDGADGQQSFEVFRIRWRDAVRGGFCVLPAERFVQEAGK